MIKIVVCLKQVPDVKNVRLDPVTNTLIREGVAAIINPYDRHALEEGVRLARENGGTVTALSMGPPQAGEILREAVACGADQAVLVSDRAFAGADTWATTHTLAQAIKTMGGADLVLCGKQAIDGDTAQVGPGLAERLGFPYVTWVRKVLAWRDNTLSLQRMMDDGYDTLEIELPALLTVVKEINEPRLPSLKGKLKAQKLQIKTLNATEINADPQQIGLKGSPTQVVRVFSPEVRGARMLLGGTVDEQVEQLALELEKLLISGKKSD